jgi:N utilization substance protein A
MLFDLKILKSTLEQIELEKKIPQAAIIDAIEQSLAAAYKRDYGKKGQIIKAKFNMENGDVDFSQIKIVVDETTVRPALTAEELENGVTEEIQEGEDVLPRFDEEKHLYIADAKRMKNDVVLGEELVFPLEQPDREFGRIAAQTAKQVIMQRLREAEKGTVSKEYTDKQGTIVTGVIQTVERGNIFVEFYRATGILHVTEQIEGEVWKAGDRIRAYLYAVDEGPRGVTLRLSRKHPQFVTQLFIQESPEVASGAVEIKSVAREAGSRSKIAVWSNDENIDPIGACVGQRGVRVQTVKDELNGENIDIIPWSPIGPEFIANALAPAKAVNIEIDEAEHMAKIEVAENQLSLAIGKRGQNVRLAARLTGWKIDIKGIKGEEVEADGTPMADEGDFIALADLVQNEAELTADIIAEEAAELTETTE